MIYVIFEAKYNREELNGKFTKDKGSTTSVLKYLSDKNIFSHIVSTQPTLNDAFLKITGKELID